MSFHCHRCTRTFPDMVNDGVHIVCNECIAPAIAKAVVGPKWRDMDVETIVVNVLKETCIDKIELGITIGDSVNIGV